MKYLKIGQVISVFALIFLSPAVVQPQNSLYDPLRLSENLEFELGFLSGYTGNLLNDSVGVEDAQTVTRGSIRYYPWAPLELNFDNEYTYYNKTYNLSSYHGTFGATYIPTPEESRFSVFLSANFDIRRYSETRKNFNNDNLDLVASAGYRIAGPLALRIGTAYHSNSYINSKVSSKKKWEFFSGLNSSFWGSNTFDFEAGYSNMDYSFILDTVWSIDTMFVDLDVEDYYSDGNLFAFYLSPRFSRSLGSKTGIGIEYDYHKFSNPDHAVILISEVEFISPFANVCEGKSVTANIKTYMVPGFIITTGSGYWEKQYLKMLQGDINFTPVLFARKRMDFQSRWFLNMERPINLGQGAILKPVLNLDYTNNNSSHGTFDYHKWSVNAGITYLF